MKVSLNWIKDFVDVPPKYSANRLAELLTLRTAEVESFEIQEQKYANMVVGRVIAIRPHPRADKLRLADTDIGGRTVQIVCGGKNLETHMLVAVALPGASVNWHGAGEAVQLKETQIRGEWSFGMICAGEEIGLPKSAPESITDLGKLLIEWSMPEAKLGTPLAKALALNDIIFEIDNKSLTHRPDLWGHYGMAREFAAFLGKKLKPFVAKSPAYLKGPGTKVKISLAKSTARRFLSVIITGIHVAESPEWIKRRLRDIGMRPVNNIVDITNYIMHELGHPLHAFDRRVVGNDTFVIRFAKQDETITTLDHKKRELSVEDILVTNGETPLAVAGVMGGANSEITPKTTEIILEVACWNPLFIRKTSQRHGLRSDAAQRFEKSLDPEITGIAFSRAVKLILKLCPAAKLEGPITDVYPSKYKPITVQLETSRVIKKIGSAISEKEMADILKAFEFGVKKGRKGILKVTIPSFRATKDINIEDDLIEEIARLHGYEKIPKALPHLPVRLPRENQERVLKHEMRQIFSLGLGFSEVNSYSFYGKAEIRKCLLPEVLHLGLDNPLTEDQTYLRASLLPGILKATALNLYHRENFKLYEVGRTYIKVDSYFPREEKFVCGALARKGAGQKQIFYDALGALQKFLERFRIEFQVEGGTCAPYAHPKKFAAIKSNQEEIAIAFEVHPDVLKNFGIEAHVAAFEINFTKLVAHGQKPRAYRPLPRFPGIEIDVSVLAPKNAPTREIYELIAKCDQALIANVKLIDIFEDRSLGADKKSLTFRILLQSPDRTLENSEMKTVQERIFDALKQNGFAIRGA